MQQKCSSSIIGSNLICSMAAAAWQQQHRIHAAAAMLPCCCWLTTVPARRPALVSLCFGLMAMRPTLFGFVMPVGKTEDA
jgi:hypothetical protein